jgi:hypothetical protein
MRKRKGKNRRCIMPYPSEYQRATDHFAKFLSDVKKISDLGSVHQSYTMAQGFFKFSEGEYH